jgi:hypothetical protein
MQTLTTETPNDIIAFVLIDTAPKMAGSVAIEVSKVKVENNDIVAAVYWVDVNKGQYDLIAGVRATIKDALEQLVNRIAAVPGVTNTYIEYQLFRYIDGVRDGGP